jgi:hypothetical protein
MIVPVHEKAVNEHHVQHAGSRMKKRVAEVVSTFVLRKLAQRDSSHLRPNSDGIPAVAGLVAWKPGAGHEQFMADKLPERPAYVHGAIVEM